MTENIKRKVEGFNSKKELKDKCMELYLEHLKTSCDIVDALIPVIWKFDNKVYNARLDNIIQKTIEEKEQWSNICSRTRLTSDQFEIELIFYKRSVRIGEQYITFPSNYDTIQIARKWCSYSSWSGNDSKNREKGFYSSSVYMNNEQKDDYFYFDENYNMRIKASRLVDYLLEKQKDLKEEIENTRENMKKALDWFTKVEELKEQLENLNDEIPYSIRMFYDIHSYGTFQ